MITGRRSSTSNSFVAIIRKIVLASALVGGVHRAAGLNTHARLYSPAEHPSAGLLPAVAKTDVAFNLLQIPMADVLESFKPVPTVVRCIVIMSCQFLLIHTALALCRTVHELTGSAKGRLEGALRAAAQTFTYGPMLCALFIACHVRVKHLSHGQDDLPEWMQACMSALTFAVLASALLVLAIQLITGAAPPPNLKAGPFDLEMGKEEHHFNKIAFYTLTALRYLVLSAMYGGLAGMIFGILNYMPIGSKRIDDIEAPAPAITSTMILSVAFFSAQFIIAVFRSYLEFARIESPQVVGFLHAAATTTELAPMLAVLFLACHMRAFQHDAPPQDWAHSCMVTSTVATCVMLLLAFLVPLTLGRSLQTSHARRNTWTSDVRLIGSRQQVVPQRRSRNVSSSSMFRDEVIVDAPNPIVGHILMAIRCLCMVCVHGGAAGVMISIFAFESPGPSTTIPVSPSLQGIVNLTGHFIFVYFVMTVMLTVAELNGGTNPMEKWRIFPAVEAARSTMALAPVLSLIFLATHLLGLSLEGGNGGLQSWVQAAMSVSTWSLQVSGLMCLATGLVMAPVELDSEGKTVNKFARWHVGVAMVVLRYVAMLLLDGGLLIVSIGMFTLTPESAIDSSQMPFESSTVVF